MSSDICLLLGRKIRALRQARGWTQEKMAETVGIDRSYLAEVETGKIELCLRNLESIAQTFEMEAWELLKPGALRKKRMTASRKS